MPLKSGKSDATRSANIAELIKSGYSKERAAAIAYKKQRESQDDENGKTFKIYDDDSNPGSARKYDLNGWPEIKDNPISKVGVFEYLGRDISPELEPDRVYKVYRPEEELNDPATIESFKLLPWTDEHEMLGDGATPAERKGVHGVIGEDVYYSDGYLKGNLKIFSNKLSQLVDSGKKELSIGYRCLYDVEQGVYNGEQYDAIQRQIRGNHIATVAEGRSGHDVAVLDHFKIAFDAKEFKMADETLKDVLEAVKALHEKLAAMMEKKEEVVEDEDEEKEIEKKEEKEVVKDEDGEKEELGKKAAEEGDTKDEGDPADFVKRADIEDEDTKKKDGDAMDSRIAKRIMHELSQRNALADKLSKHIGTFDHSDKTVREVAAYGLKKLKLSARPGHEISMIEGYLAAAKVSPVASVQDEKIKSTQIEAYLSGDK